MVNFAKKRLQVFVSSTYDDLIIERQAAVEAILTAGHIPAGMELFAASDESQLEVIKQWIEESDVFLLILAGRYGSIEPKTKKSYIQIEYEYAVKLRKPLFACVINETALENRVKTSEAKAIKADNSQNLEKFRKKVLTKLSSFWEDSKDIKIAISEALSNFSRRDDLMGWVKFDKEVNAPELLAEMLRLSKENASLRSQISNGKPEELFCGVNFHEMKALLQKKGLLDYLINHRLLLLKPYLPRIQKETEIAEGLCQLDLMSKLDGYQYIITSIGKAFLNKFDAVELFAQDDNKDGACLES